MAALPGVVGLLVVEVRQAHWGGRAGRWGGGVVAMKFPGAEERRWGDGYVAARGRARCPGCGERPGRAAGSVPEAPGFRALSHRLGVPGTRSL